MNWMIFFAAFIGIPVLFLLVYLWMLLVDMIFDGDNLLSYIILLSPLWVSSAIIMGLML